MDIQPIKQEKPSNLIVKALWDLILSGELKPGDRLPPERKLMKRFEVSQVTLREALNTLEAWGHITKKRGAHGGSIILEITPTQGLNLIVDYLENEQISLEQVRQAALMVFPECAAVATPRLTSSNRSDMLSILEDMRRDLEVHGGSSKGWEFTIYLGELTGNPAYRVMAEMAIRLMMLMEFRAGIGDTGSSDVERAYNTAAYESLKSVADAMVAGNPEYARTTMRNILESAFDALEAALRSKTATGPDS